MYRRPGAGVIYWVLVMTATGVVLLLRNMDYAIPVWELLVLYWPLLLIVWGAVKAVEYFHMEGQKRQLFSGGEVALLVFVVIAGSAFTAAAHLASDSSVIGLLGEDFDVFDILGENFEFSSRLEQNVPSGAQIEVRNLYGPVEVRAGESGRLVVDIVKSVRAATRDEAARMEPEMEFTLREREGVYVIEPRRNARDSRRPDRFRSRLDIEVPVESSVMVNNRHGAVQLSGLTGTQEVRNGYGAVVVSDISGDVAVESRYSRIEVEDIHGDVRVQGRNAAVAVQDVDGAVQVESSHRDVEVGNVTGPVTVSTRHGDVHFVDD